MSHIWSHVVDNIIRSASSLLFIRLGGRCYSQSQSHRPEAPSSCRGRRSWTGCGSRAAPAAGCGCSSPAAGLPCLSPACRNSP